MIISHSKKFIFIHFEKCGGTSVENALEPYLSWDDIILGSTEYGESAQALLFRRYGMDNVQNNMLWKHSNAYDIYKYLGRERWKEYKKIVIVRDPMEIMQSLYFFSQNAIKYHTGRIHEEVWKEWVSNNSFPQEWPYVEKYVQAYMESKVKRKGFNYFVEIILNNDYNFSKPQVKRIRSNLFFPVGLDKVIDLSQLDDRWDEITSFIGIKEKVPLNKLNVVERDFELEINSATRSRIRNHFSKDYRYMKYFTNVSWD